MNQLLQISACAMTLLLSTSFMAQGQVKEDFVPSTKNHPGKEYPMVNSQGYARFKVDAPEAKSVTVTLGLGGSGGTKLEKQADGESGRGHRELYGDGDEAHRVGDRPPYHERSGREEAHEQRQSADPPRDVAASGEKTLHVFAGRGEQRTDEHDARRKDGDGYVVQNFHSSGCSLRTKIEFAGRYSARSANKIFGNDFGNDCDCREGLRPP